ncbi:Uncharacterised protein [Neisseria gonorrhoeae]|uniref:HNH nuclease domain-containing protein n=1 Tax=Neisseria gonorrhoeae TaxID=485 RepID=A0A378VYV9_NEIGO|nr:Uncharacterised protein [Neisseria gonorrhoeae]
MLYYWIKQPELLVASHIKPWREDKDNRLNPRNGLCLNALHDKAFDRGLLGIDENFKIIFLHYWQKQKDLMIYLNHMKIG